MKSYNIFIGVILLSITGFLFNSCEGDYNIDYEWKAMYVVNGDNYSYWPKDNSSDSILASAYVIRVHLNTQELKREGRYLDWETPPKNVNELDSLIITSVNEFDSLHPAGTFLNSFFSILNDSYLKTLPADGSKGYGVSKVYALDYQDAPNVSNIDLLLHTRPSSYSIHRFRVEMILENGQHFIDTTSFVNLY